MKKKVGILLLGVCFCMVLQSCTRRAWYEGLKEQQCRECYKYQNSEEIRRCLERVNQVPYDEYEKVREESD